MVRNGALVCMLSIWIHNFEVLILPESIEEEQFGVVMCEADRVNGLLKYNSKSEYPCCFDRTVMQAHIVHIMHLCTQCLINIIKRHDIARASGGRVLVSHLIDSIFNVGYPHTIRINCHGVNRSQNLICQCIQGH